MCFGRIPAGAHEIFERGEAAIREIVQRLTL